LLCVDLSFDGSHVCVLLSNRTWDGQGRIDRPHAPFVCVRWLFDGYTLGALDAETTLNEPPLARSTSRRIVTVDYDPASGAVDSAACGRLFSRPCATLPFALRQQELRSQPYTTIRVHGPPQGQPTIRLAAGEPLQLSDVFLRVEFVPSTAAAPGGSRSLLTVDCAEVADACVRLLPSTVQVREACLIDLLSTVPLLGAGCFYASLAVLLVS
jgi:hypothetical protein